MKKITVLLSLLLTVVCLFCFAACGANVSRVALNRSETDRTESLDEGKEYGSIEEAKEDVLSANIDEETAAYADDGFLFGYFGYVEYGMYPQTVATKDALKQMSQTTDGTGYYVSAFDNAHYARIAVASVYGNRYEFSNEKEITARDTYYFKVEPIKWQVFGQADLSTGMRTLYLLSDLILDSSEFIAANKFTEDPGEGVFYIKDSTKQPSDWFSSDLRTFLNDEFRFKAFTAEEQQKLIPQETTVTVIEENEETGEAEEKEQVLSDLVFALSYERASSIIDTYRVAQVSDYARCRGTFMSVHANWYGNGRWWTSTPGSKMGAETYTDRDSSYRVSFISDYIANGVTETVAAAESVMVQGESVASTYMGVRPAIMISVDSAYEILTEEEEKK